MRKNRKHPAGYPILNLSILTKKAQASTFAAQPAWS